MSYVKKKSVVKKIKKDKSPKKHSVQDGLAGQHKPLKVKNKGISKSLNIKNPRHNKKSYFFGGEFSIPLAQKADHMTAEAYAKLCCEKLVDCEFEDVYWWVVYKQFDNIHGEYVLTTAPHRAYRYTTNAGMILIKKSDASLSYDKTVYDINKELRDYAAWLSLPMAI